VIPLPTAASRGDQIENARLFAEKGYGRVALQASLTPESLVAEVRAALASAEDFVRAMDEAESHDPVTRIVDLIDELG
jgi:UDP-N-acetylglucosamine--N-acetylmuramyl-(pentapeptide) pyrophosphoryl-undecaprenol N-acetylglucosamine transferase